jgi:hypothetical protein
LRWHGEYGLCGSPAGTEILIESSESRFVAGEIKSSANFPSTPITSLFPFKATITSNNLFPFSGHPLSNNP